MAVVVGLISLMMLCTIAIKNQNCEAVSTYNVTIERQPSKMVEIIQLTLPHSVRERGKEVGGTEARSDEVQPGYEIFIKPNKNRRDGGGGGQKIKIFVESEDHSGEKSVLNNSSVVASESIGEHKSYTALPLTINTFGPNVDNFQHSRLGKENLNNDKSTTTTSAFPSKRQIYPVDSPGERSSSFSSENIKAGPPPKESSALGESRRTSSVENVYGGSILPQKQNGRNDENKYGHPVNSGGDLSSSITASALTHREASFERESNDYRHRDHITRQSYSSGEIPLDRRESHHHRPSTREPESHHSTYVKNAEIHGFYHGNENGPSTNNRRSMYDIERVGVTQIADTDLKPQHHSRLSQEESATLFDETESGGGRQTFNPTYDETRIPSNREPIYEEPEGITVRNPARVEEVQRRPTFYGTDQIYSSMGRRSSSSQNVGRLGSFSAGTTQYDETRPNGRDSYVRTTIYVARGNEYGIDADDSASISSTGLPYETVNNREHTTTVDDFINRPVRENSYSGFPESFNTNINNSTRPNSYEGSSSFPASPCPTVFSYAELLSGRWYGDVKVFTDEDLVGMRLDITLDRPAELMAAWSAEVKSRDNSHFTVLSLKKKLVAGHTETVRIMAKFQEGEPPLLQTINLNGRKICPSRTNPVTQRTKAPVYVFPGDVASQKRTTETYKRPINEYTTTTRRTTPKTTVTAKKTTPWTEYLVSPNPQAYENSELEIYDRPTTKRPSPNRPSLTNVKPSSGSNKQRPPHSGNVEVGNSHPRPVNEQISQGINSNNNGKNKSPSTTHTRKPAEQQNQNIPCGLPSVQPRPLITNGQMTTRGQWPWHAALYKNIGPNLTYSCGGSLVSNLHVITAAHCVTTEYSSRPLDPRILLVYLGKYHLYIWTENGIANREVSRIIIHPNYNATDFRSDIAILTLSNRVDFTDYIRPVCLWDKRNTRIEDIVGHEGTVVGWGFDETKELTEELRQAKMPVVKHNECLWSYPDFYPKFTSNTTYCAGFKNGTSVCNGDSGGGMVFRLKVNREERWFLRGLVSLSPGLKDTRICDTKHYVVFTDLAQYLPWLDDYIS